VRRPVFPPSAAEPIEVRVERIGAEGDGVATLPDGGRIYIPLTLPGELVRVEPMAVAGGAGSLAGVGRLSPDRITPPCPYFGLCGGCTLQHWRGAAYASWKSDLLREALRRAGYPDPPVAALAQSAPGQRRRMDLAAQRTAQGVSIGLHRRGSRTMVDLHECLVLHPALASLLAPLRTLLSRLHALRREASIIANLLDHGADLLLRTDAACDRADREALIAFARAQRLVRVSCATARAGPEPVVMLQPPRITLSGVRVELPPGGFLQATSAGEAAIARAVLAGPPQPIPTRARIAELYAGSGSLTFALVQRTRVAAWEGDGIAAAALRQAANHAGLAGRVTVAQRDLARQPLSAAELASFEAVVLDPPFAGAAVQTAQIAAAKVARVVYVSCNPAVLARDARMLREAGYAVLAATPVDQFLWSARLESVCVFESR
jgi:23S rRNA (uracil1939-C5)-methyltransferase